MIAYSFIAFTILILAAATGIHALMYKRLPSYRHDEVWIPWLFASIIMVLNVTGHADYRSDRFTERTLLSPERYEIAKTSSKVLFTHKSLELTSSDVYVYKNASDTSVVKLYLVDERNGFDVNRDFVLEVEVLK